MFYQDLRRGSLSLSEIVHSLLIMAHYHAVAGNWTIIDDIGNIFLAAISSVLRKIKENKEKQMQTVYKSDCLKNRRLTKGKKNNECSDLFGDREGVKEERYILDERLCGISCVGILWF